MNAIAHCLEEKFIERLPSKTNTALIEGRLSDLFSGKVNLILHSINPEGIKESENNSWNLDTKR
jgi:hypothetical protein